MPSRLRQRKNENNTSLHSFKKMLIASGIGTVLLAALFCIAAAVCLRCDLNGGMVRVFAYLPCAAAAMTTGFIAGKTVGKSGMLFGAAAALLLCVLPVSLTLILHKSAGAGLLIAVGLIVLFGALGGVLSVNTRRRRRYR